MALYELNPFSKRMERADAKVPTRAAAITVSSSLGLEDEYVPVDATAGNVAITLPLSNGQSNGKQYEISKIDSSANTVTITCSGTDTIKGAATMIILYQWSTAHIVSNGDGTWGVI